MTTVVSKAHERTNLKGVLSDCITSGSSLTARRLSVPMDHRFDFLSGRLSGLDFRPGFFFCSHGTSNSQQVPHSNGYSYDDSGQCPMRCSPSVIQPVASNRWKGHHEANRGDLRHPVECSCDWRAIIGLGHQGSQ